MSHQLSIHIHEEMERRGIPLAVVESVLAAPSGFTITRTRYGFWLISTLD